MPEDNLTQPKKHSLCGCDLYPQTSTTTLSEITGNNSYRCLFKFKRYGLLKVNLVIIDVALNEIKITLAIQNTASVFCLSLIKEK